MGYYSALKKNEILPFAVTRMELKSIVLLEKDIPYDFTLTFNLRNKTKEQREENREMQTNQQTLYYREQSVCYTTCFHRETPPKVNY